MNVKLLGGNEDGEIMEFRDTQIEQTDLVHEAKVMWLIIDRFINW